MQRYVEMIGLPGAGKSSVARQLGMPALAPVLAWRRHRFRRADLARIAPASRQLVRCSKTLATLSAWGRGGRIIARAMVKRCWEYGPGVTQHGFLQTLAQHPTVSRQLCDAPKTLERVLSTLPPLTGVFLDVPIETAKRRVAERATYTLHDSVYDEHQRFFEALLRVAPAIHRIDATPPLAVVISAARQALRAR